MDLTWQLQVHDEYIPLTLCMCLSRLFLGLCIWLLVYVYVCWCSYCLSFGIGNLFLRSENAQMLPYHEIEDHKSWFWWCSIGNVLNDMVCLTIMAQFHQQKAIFKCWNPALQWYCEQKVAADNQKPTKAVISLHHQVIWYWDLMLKKLSATIAQTSLCIMDCFPQKKNRWADRTSRGSWFHCDAKYVFEFHHDHTNTANFICL